jgi:hypothetical protein
MPRENAIFNAVAGWTDGAAHGRQPASESVGPCRQASEGTPECSPRDMTSQAKDQKKVSLIFVGYRYIQ